MYGLKTSTLCIEVGLLDPQEILGWKGDRKTRFQLSHPPFLLFFGWKWVAQKLDTWDIGHMGHPQQSHFSSSNVSLQEGHLPAFLSIAIAKNNKGF